MWKNRTRISLLIVVCRLAACCVVVMLCGVLWRVASCRVVSWLWHVVVSGVGLWYVVVFTLSAVVWRCSVLWCVALGVGTWRAPRVTSVVVLLRCAVFLFVFLLFCAFCAAALCRSV